MRLIKILIEPQREDKWENNIKYSNPNCATVTLLQTNKGSNILVDTGAHGYSETLVDKLLACGLKTSDIDNIILTHAHFDHNANIYLFDNAKLVYDKWLIDISNGSTQKFGKAFKEIPQIGIKDISLVRTPGHTEDSISVFCEYAGKRYGIVGDSVKASLINKGLISKDYSDPTAYKKSMQYIFKNTDVIISGDDGLIEGSNFSKLRDKVRNIKTEA